MMCRFDLSELQVQVNIIFDNTEIVEEEQNLERFANIPDESDDEIASVDLTTVSIDSDSENERENDDGMHLWHFANLRFVQDRVFLLPHLLESSVSSSESNDTTNIRIGD